ncbi:MAG: hypothetical protein V3U27_21570 [Candidatus Tectomicrobia bacterium]
MAIDFESLTISSSAVSITATIIDQHHDDALITVETAAVRFRIDGTAPTATVGHVLEVGDILELRGVGEIGKFQAIRRDGSDATLRVSTGTVTGRAR